MHRVHVHGGSSRTVFKGAGFRELKKTFFAHTSARGDSARRQNAGVVGRSLVQPWPKEVRPCCQKYQPKDEALAQHIDLSPRFWLARHFHEFIPRFFSVNRLFQLAVHSTIRPAPQGALGDLLASHTSLVRWSFLRSQL